MDRKALGRVAPPSRRGVAAVPETAPHGLGLIGLTGLASVPVLIKRLTGRAAWAKRDAIAVTPAARATVGGPRPVEASKATKTPMARPKPVPPAGAITRRYEGPGGHRRARGAYQERGRPAVVAEAPLRGLLYGPINGRVKATTRPSIDGPAVPARPLHPKRAPVRQGPPIRRMVRPLKDRRRRPA